MNKVITRYIFILFSFASFLSFLFSPILYTSAADGNIVPNPSVETVSTSDSTLPDGWVKEKAGTNNTTFTYLTTGHTGSRSLKVEMTSRTSGDSHYKFNQQTVTPSGKYDFSFYYQSNVTTEVDAEITLSDGSLFYIYIGDVPASTTWKQYTNTVTMPATAAKATVYATIYKVGYLITDDYSLSSQAVTPIAATPTFSPAAGTYTSAQTVIISDTTSGAIIYYTTDGTTPTTSSSVYTTPLIISTTTTLKAIAVASGYTNSAVGSATYTIVSPGPAGNLVPNPSVETVSPTNSALPQYWTKSKSGNNTTTFTYLTTGHTGGRSIKVNCTKYNSGDAYYTFDAQPVTPNTEYDFSVYYQSNLYTEIFAEVTFSNGNTDYVYLGYSWPSSTWNQFSHSFTTPANAVKATVYVGVASKGWLITDDYYMGLRKMLTPLNRAIVTLTYDEMNKNVYTYGYPLFTKYNMKGDLYLLSNQLGTAGMMTKDQLLAYKNFGFEIGSHTVTHPYLTQITSAQLDTELKDSQTALSSYFGIPINSFASPYGEYNDDVVAAIKKYYKSHRTTDEDFNTKDNFDPYKIKAWSIESDMSADYVKALIDKAVAEKTWLVLVYHDIRPDDGSGDLWTTTPANMESVLSYLQTKGVAVETTPQAISEIQGQM